MKPERLLPLLLLVVGAVVFYIGYEAKTATLEVPEAFQGHRAIELFYQHECVTCHTVSTLENARGTLGPGLDDIGRRSREIDPDNQGRGYLTESILEPSKVVREGFIDAMPSYRDKLDSDDLETLVEWLASLGYEENENN